MGMLCLTPALNLFLWSLFKPQVWLPLGHSQEPPVDHWSLKKHVGESPIGFVGCPGGPPLAFVIPARL